MDYKKATLEQIVEWCKANNQIAWLKENYFAKEEVKVYPKIASTSKSGKKSWKADKTQAPTTKTERIPYITFKKRFFEKFFPEQLPKATSKAVDWEAIIRAL